MAQRVSKQNVRLRELLRRIGFDDVFIDAWVRQMIAGTVINLGSTPKKRGYVN